MTSCSQKSLILAQIGITLPQKQVIWGALAVYLPMLLHLKNVQNCATRIQNVSSTRTMRRDVPLGEVYDWVARESLMRMVLGKVDGIDRG